MLNIIFQLAVLLTLIAISMGGIASAQIGADSLESMKLLMAEVGWARTERNLFGTTNGGAAWRDITPALAPGEVIADVFFLDSSSGFVLLSRYAEPQPQFRMASTSNAGAAWSLSSVRVPSLDSAGTVLAASGGRINFVDFLHGWMNLAVVSSAASHRGTLLETEDGGKTWNRPPAEPGTAGPIRFLTVTDGWVVSPDGDELEVTHDGSKSWQMLSLDAPPHVQVAAQRMMTYDLPCFDSGQHGFLTVAYSDGSRTALVLFKTVDGGKNWKPDRILPHVKEAASILAGSSWISVSIGSGQALTLKLTDLSLETDNEERTPIRTSADISNLRGLRRVGGVRGSDELSFVDPTQGWVLAGKLLATSDHGITWMDITPSQVKRAGSATPLSTSPTTIPSGFATFPKLQDTNVATLASTTHVSKHLGFDISRVLCTSTNCSTAQSVTYMQNWWKSSPYFDTSLYLPGSPNRGTDANLNASWVTAVQQQGWGLIPTWFGLQAPCACRAGTYPSCTQNYTGKFSPDPITAHAQGIAEADTAVSKAAAFGLTSTIIYHDIENYAPSSTCSPAVQKFLDGWVSELHLKGFKAGVYGNPGPAKNDFSKVSPLPDDVWIAKYDSRVTIWGLSPLCDAYSISPCDLWANNQRIHQYTNTHNETWGSTPSFGIDNDIQEAQIAGGHGIKTYKFTFQAIDNPSVPLNFLFGINNKGVIVGEGGVYKNGNFTFLNYPGTATLGTTVTRGINNAGQIVGSYSDATGTHGFLYTNGSFIQITCFQSFETEVWAINDNGQISGFYFDSNSFEHGFLYNNGSCTTVDPVGSIQTNVFGIDGFTDIFGMYDVSGGSAFGFRQNKGAFTPVPFPDGSANCGLAAAQCYYAYDINNDLEIVGSWTDSNSHTHGFLDENGHFTYFDYPGAMSTIAHGINDKGQIVGYWSDAQGVFHGFLANPQ